MKRAQVLGAALVLALAMTANSWGACTAPKCTKIIDNGPDSGKRIMAIMGDGFAAADQTEWNNLANSLLVDGVFGNDFFKEQQNAFNVYRLNLVSTDSGVSTKTYDEKGTPGDASDDTVTSTTTKNTALKYIYSGSWAHCWLEGSANTNTLVQNALNESVPNATLVVVVLNNPGFGGCGGGGRQVVTKSSSWQVLAHEFGHGTGGLWDEYVGSGRGDKDFPGAASNNRNCSTVNNRNTVYWNRFIDPATSVPTTLSGGMDSNRTVGEFEGCGTWGKKIYRPVDNCRMKGNSPNFCPVCQTIMRNEQYANLQHDFDQAYAGDFNGDGKDDVLIKNGGDLAIYRSTTSPKKQLDRVWTANNRVPSAPGSGYWWNMASGDQLFVTDFNGDGKDDVIVLNTSTWGDRYLGLWASDGTGLGVVRWYKNTIPGYGSIGKYDKLYVGDFDGDAKDDLYIFTGTSWTNQYLGMLKSTGTALTGVKTYSGDIVGYWYMAKYDQYYVGDLNGDGKADLYTFNGSNWSYPYMTMLKSTGAALAAVKRYDQTLPGWQMTPGDRFYVGDFDGDAKEDLYVFNGSNWCCAYLLMAKSTGTGLAYVKRYNDGNNDSNNIPGWKMRKGDRFYIADADKNGKKDLFVYNPKTNWSYEYLGTLMSSGSALSGSWSQDWVNGIAGAGGWNLGLYDKIIPVNYEGGAGKADIFIRNTHWFGMIRRGSSSFVMDRHYHDWIYSPLYDKKPWALGMP